MENYAAPNKMRKSRAFAPKRRTGCITCRQRHIRCDEASPVCFNCAKGSRICVKNARSAKDQADKPRIFAAIRPRVSMPFPVLQHRPISPLLLCEEELRYFFLFRSITANARSGFFNSVFWTGTTLQASHFSPAVRHALIAIGALYKSLDILTTTPRDKNVTSETAAIHHDFALRQYSKAIRHARTSIEEGKNVSLRTTIILCVLFSCFESFHGDPNAAMAQIHSGMKLLKDRQCNASLLSSHGNDGGVEDHLVQLFRDTANSMTTYNMSFYRKVAVNDDTTTFPVDPAGVAPFPDIPDVFLTLEEARGTWESLKMSVMQFVMSVKVFDCQHYMQTASGNSDRSHMAALMRRCASAMQPLLEQMRGSPDFLALNATYLDLKMSLFLFHFTFEANDTYHAAYHTDFIRLLDLAETVFNYQNQEKSNDLGRKFGTMTSSPPVRQKAHFAFDPSVIYPLFHVATHCRISSVRRRAIALLAAANRREGLWDSALAAKVAQKFMEIEEHGMEAGAVIPEDKRVILQKVEYEDNGRTAAVHFVSKGGLEQTVRFSAWGSG